MIKTGYAHSLTATGDRTNLEALEAIEALFNIANAIEQRGKAAKNDSERQELNQILQRFSNPKCAFDHKYRKELMGLIVAPEQISWQWKLRERLHRFLHHH